MWPDTEMEPMGLRKVTMGARLTKGICGGAGASRVTKPGLPAWIRAHVLSQVLCSWQEGPR